MTTAPPQELTRDQKIYSMLGTLLGLLLAALDQTIVATAGPVIQKDLKIEPSLYVWLTTAYLVASTVLVPIYGKLSDIYGRRRILVVAISVFLLGSLLCGLAQTPLQLILFRAVQGAGSAGLFTSAFAVVADLFPPQERGKYQGLFGAVFGLSSVFGPLVGGFLTDTVGWHWCFFVNLPIGAFALLLIATRMPPLKQARATNPAIDFAGAATLSVAVVPLLLALSLGKTTVHPGETGFLWDSWQLLTMFGIAVVGILLFITVELRAADPILDMRLFGNRAFALGNLAAFVAGGSFLGAIVFLPLFMVNVVGLSATSSGLTTTPLTLGMVAANISSGQLVSRVGRYKAIILASLAVLVGGFVLMGFTLSPDSTQLSVSWKMVIVGVGLGPSIPLFTLALQNSVPPHQIGVATATGTFCRQLGATVGIAVLGTVFASSLAEGMKVHLAEATQGAPAEFVSQFSPGAPSTEEGAAARPAFDAAAVKARIHASFEAQRTRVADTLQKQDLDTAEQQAMMTVDKVARALKQAFSDAVTDLYKVSILIALLAFLVTLAMPELPLRAGPPAARPPAE